MNWKDKINKRYIQIALYVIITVIIIYTLILILYNAPAITDFIIEKVKWLLKVVKPVILGFVFAYLLDPIADFFEKKYRRLKNVRIFHRLVAPRTWAAVTSVLLLAVVVVSLISILVFSVTDQLRLANLDDIVELAQVYMNSIREFYNAIITRLKELDIQSQEFEKYVENATMFIMNALMGFADATVDSLTNISGYLTTFIFSFIIGFYFLIDGKMIISYLKKVCRALFSNKTNQKITRMMNDLDQVFSGYIRGQLIDAAVMMLLISSALSVIGVRFSVFIGVCAGIGNLIPYFGPIVAYAGTTLVCLINGDMKRLIISLIALFLIQSIDGNIIGPKLLSKAIQIHPLIIIISIIFGSALGGFLGMLLAVPVGAYIKLNFVRLIDHRLERKETL